MKKLFFTVIILTLTTSIYGNSELCLHKIVSYEAAVKHKSKKKVLALSLLLPGLGEQYMGHKRKAIRACVIEATIWSAFFGGKWYANVLKNDYILYAHSNSGARTGKEENYYGAIEWYPDLKSYNVFVREESRAIYPDSIEARKKYEEEHSLADTLAWKWANDEEWDKYRELRNKNRSIIKNTSYCVGAAILNRIASAIIATHLPESGFGLQIEPNGFKINFALK